MIQVKSYVRKGKVVKAHLRRRSAMLKFKKADSLMSRGMKTSSLRRHNLVDKHRYAAGQEISRKIAEGKRIFGRTAHISDWGRITKRLYHRKK